MISKITYRSPNSKSDFDKYYELRWRILRKPWNQPKGSEVNNRDSDAFHIMAEIDDKVIGVGCIHELEKGVGRVRFMGVDDNYHMHGIGKKLMEYVEEYAKQQNWNLVRLWARENAIYFYLRLNYEIVADGELLFGVIKHKIMEKRI